MPQLIETATGTYEIRETPPRFVVWSTKHFCPIGSYWSLEEATQALNSIQEGDPLPGQPSAYDTLDGLLSATALLTHWDPTLTDLSLTERLLLAAQKADNPDEVSSIVEMALRAEQLRRQE